MLQTLLPQLRLTPALGADPFTYFSAAVEDVWLEIGFGSGEHLLEQARAHPYVGLVGAEPYVAGIAKIAFEARRRCQLSASMKATRAM